MLTLLQRIRARLLPSAPREDRGTDLDWPAKLAQFTSEAARGDSDLTEYASANIAACRDLIEGVDFYSGQRGKDGGARMVVNMSSAHVPSFCLASRKGDPKPYKNGYDLNHFTLGARATTKEPRLREIVDASLPLAGVSPANAYYGALELTGAGIRFYGDICLVLRAEAVAPNTTILDRNSFDLITPPLRDRINETEEGPQRDNARASEAQKLAGRWAQDAGNMGALKALQSIGLRARRYTAGQIAEGVRYDEDYLEILREGSFGAKDLQEARLSTGEAALDAFTIERTSNGPAPRLETLMWVYRRRQAERCLREEGVGVRVVTGPGRE